MVGVALAPSCWADDESGQSTPAALTVSVVKPQTSSWPQEVTASGWLAAWQEAVISTEIGEQKIVAVNADVGDTVKKDDVLVELSQESLINDVAEQQASLDSSIAALDEAKANADRARQVKETGSVSQQQIVEYLVDERKAEADVDSAKAKLASSKLDLQRTRIVAVSDGVISSRSAALGDVVSVGDEMFKLIRDNRIEWQAEVPVAQLQGIAVGTPVIIPMASGEVKGKVRQIAPSASDTNGRVKVYVALDEPKGAPALKVSMMVTGNFELGESKALSVPASAIVQSDGFSYVFILAGDNPAKVTRERVTTGRRQDDRVELVGDFSADAEVVVAGGAFLSEGSTVKVVSDDSAATADATSGEGATE